MVADVVAARTVGQYYTATTTTNLVTVTIKWLQLFPLYSEKSDSLTLKNVRRMYV